MTNNIGIYGKYIPIWLLFGGSGGGCSNIVILTVYVHVSRFVFPSQQFKSKKLYYYQLNRETQAPFRLTWFTAINQVFFTKYCL